MTLVQIADSLAADSEKFKQRAAELKAEINVKEMSLGEMARLQKRIYCHENTARELRVRARYLRKYYRSDVM